MSDDWLPTHIVQSPHSRIARTHAAWPEFPDEGDAFCTACGLGFFKVVDVQPYQIGGDVECKKCQLWLAKAFKKHGVPTQLTPTPAETQS